MHVLGLVPALVLGDDLAQIYAHRYADNRDYQDGADDGAYAALVEGFKRRHVIQVILSGD
jgi:hypothetical protein